MFLRLLLILMTCVPSLATDDHRHHHGSTADKEPRRPRIFLDKSPRIVAYQLQRLNNESLLLVETATDHPKYIPVFRAILLRDGMARKNRDDAAAGLAALNETDVATELLTVLASRNDRDGEQLRVEREISSMLLSQPGEVLASRIEEFRNAVTAGTGLLRSTAHAALIVTNYGSESWQIAQRDEESRLSWLSAVSLVPAGPVRQQLRGAVVSLLAPAQPQTVRINAIRALAMIEAEAGDTFRRLAPFVSVDEFRPAAVASLLTVPDGARDEDTSGRIADVLVRHAEQTPAAHRTTDEFLDAMQLVDELLSRLSRTDAEDYRRRLQEVTVRVVRLRTVEEEMRYDRPFFAVESGRPVQLVLENHDLMPHNLVITAPGQLRKVALAAAALGNSPGLDGKLYVPNRPDVLFSTDMVNAGRREILTFNAPTTVGEYPCVCTFPRHWMRMYCVMVVVPDLDAWQRHPVVPRDPLGNKRSFVKKWHMTDFPEAAMSKALQDRSPDIGARLFKEATCLSCHKIDGDGGAVGPELTDVVQRLKSDYHGVLREILEPSYRIDPKYVVKTVVGSDGRTTSGIVTAEDRASISILVNPDVSRPTVIRKDQIEEIIPSTTSMMPKSLLDRFTYDEILEILSYIANPGK